MASGDDFLVGMRGRDALHGDNGVDTMIGGPGNDSLHGGNGDDQLFGAFGSDSLHGGNGDDLLNGDLPFPVGDDGSSPPGAYDDEVVGETDTCDGGNGSDAQTFCESQTNVEENPDPSTVVVDP